jgi:hypothetical protein
MEAGADELGGCEVVIEAQAGEGGGVTGLLEIGVMNSAGVKLQWKVRLVNAAVSRVCSKSG